MAHQAVKPYSLLMYLLAIIAFFFLGLVYAGITEAAKGQMLAGGAIVFGYGVIGAITGLILSLIAAFRAKRSLIIKLNVLLLLIIVASISYFRINYKKRQQEKLENELPNTEKKTIPEPTAPASDAQLSEPIAMSLGPNATKQAEAIMGLGMFTPNIHTENTLYFYGGLTPGKSVQEHTPTDSITFKRLEYGGFEIATAPPWLVPDHLKLDYDMLYFKVKSLSHDFIEVVVNTSTNQTAFVDRYAGKLQHWPEFLLGVQSVEFIEVSKQKVHVRSFENSSIVSLSYSFMKPTKIQHNWMLVELLNDNFNVVGTGWIQWKNENKLLIRYSLLS